MAFKDWWDTQTWPAYFRRACRASYSTGYADGAHATASPASDWLPRAFTPLRDADYELMIGVAKAVQPRMAPGSVVGYIMTATHGKADPQRIMAMLDATLRPAEKESEDA